MYVKPGCPYSEAARESLSAEGLDREERAATRSRRWRDELFRHPNDTGIAPTIVGPDGTTVCWEGRG